MHLHLLPHPHLYSSPFSRFLFRHPYSRFPYSLCLSRQHLYSSLRWAADLRLT